MSMTDPIADLLNRVRNAQTARHKTLVVPASRMKGEIVKILMDSGYIESFKRDRSGPQGVIEIELKYDRDGKAAIEGLERVSRPGKRVYCGKADLPTVLGGLGITILSTPQGVMTGAACARKGVGGEVLCNIW
jgi:small subunit ribosomal protein S8